MDTTAEGIEAPEQLAELETLGCAEGQGFLFSQARPAGAVADMLARGGANRERGGVSALSGSRRVGKGA